MSNAPKTTNGNSNAINHAGWQTPFEIEEHAEIVGDLSYKENLLSSSNKNENQQSFYWSKEATMLLKQVQFWLENRNWYIERGLCWRRGAILYGKPGTGKSAMALQVAKEVDFPIYKVNISTFSDQKFLQKMEELKDGIVLFEEMDVIFNKDRENKSENTFMLKVDYGVFINAISNPKYASSKFMIATTNFLDRLDEAVIRPGRFDCHIPTGFLDLEGKRYIASNILRDWPDEIEKSLQTGDMTVADFENYCIETAIIKFENEALLKKDLHA